MKGKRLLLARVLGRSHLLGLLGRASAPGLVVFNYHRIRGTSASPATEFEDGVFGPSLELFEAQLAWLARNTEVLSEDDVIARLEGGREFGRPSTLVTFDDGYADNYHLAYPALRRHGVPATFFIPTGIVSSRRLGWWDRLAYVVKHTRVPAIDLDGAAIQLTDVEAAVDAITSLLKSQPGEPDEALLDRLASSCGVAIPGPEVQGAELMSWDQLREVSRNGVSIGSHSHSHPALARIVPAAQRRELETSREILEREVGRPVRSVAYPFGGTGHFDEVTKVIARECGFSLGFSFRPGVNRLRELDRFALLRMRPPDEPELFAASTLLPRLFRQRPSPHHVERGAPGHEGLAHLPR